MTISTSGARPDPVVRPACPDDTPGILGLIAASYERQDDARRLAYWRWKHEANPFGCSPCLVAERDGRLIGVRAFLRWTWSSLGREVRAVRAVDTATHPDWRGQGVFATLTTHLAARMQREGVRFIYNTPNSKSMPGYLRMGWALVTRIPLWVRPVSLTGLAKASVGAAAGRPPALRELGDAATVLDDERLAGFLAAVAPHDDRYHTPRTPAYLRWRYGHVPGVAYRARLELAGDDGALVVARGRMRGGVREVTISELLVTPTPRGLRIGRAVLAHLARTADADYIAGCAPRGTAERRVMARSGFLPVPRLGPHFTARRLNAGGPDPARWASWRCSIGDLELF